MATQVSAFSIFLLRPARSHRAWPGSFAALTVLAWAGTLSFTGKAFADGDETIGPVREGFPIAQGSGLYAAGVGLQDSQPRTLELDVPPNERVVQTIAYWALRSAAGDSTIILNGTTVKGELIGTSPPMEASTRPYVFRADITQLNLIKAGHNEVQVSGLKITDTGFENGAGIVAITREGEPADLTILDGCDFAYWRYAPPLTHSERQTFTFGAANFPRQARLLLMVADHMNTSKEKDRPSTLEIEVAGAPLAVIHNPMEGSDGSSWDTIELQVDIPAGSGSMEVQLFSDDRLGSGLSCSSFFWVFAGLEMPEAEAALYSISGKVYSDTNGNAQVDAGEAGIPGVELKGNCTRGAESFQLSTFTNAEGDYTLEPIEPGATCTVVVTPSPLIEDLEPTEVCPTHSNIQADITGCDFGYATPPVVGDTVFFDLNGDGAQQEGEPGLAGVKVTIESPAGDGFPGYSDSKTTDTDGKYLFRIPGVPAGTPLVSTVTMDPKTGSAAGKELTTANPQQTIPLGPGGTDLARDFGLKSSVGEAQVGDTVFGDQNRSGFQDAGELGLSNVLVILEVPAQGGFAGFSTTTRTDAQGKYIFTVPGIPEGEKVTGNVSIDPTTGAASGRELTTPNPQTTIPLGPGDKDLDRDFGLAPKLGDATVGDTVFCDLNENGKQDPGEPGIPGVIVVLTAAAQGGFPGATLCAVTDKDGKYLFVVSGIPFGETIVAKVEVNLGSPSLAGKILLSPNPQDTKPLGPGDSDLDRDFAFRCAGARVGDTVFHDLNGNGVQDGGEPGLPNVRVTIEAPAQGTFGGYSNDTTTDDNGKYHFMVEGIPEGINAIATVTVDPTTGGAVGKEFTTPNPQNTIPLAPGVEDLDRDFGLRATDVRTEFCLVSKTVKSGECAEVPILLSSTHPVEGFVVALKHEGEGLQLESMTISGTATETGGADFASFELFPEGGVVAVVMDLEAPFLGNTIPPGDDITVAIYKYCCPAVAEGSPARAFRLRFVSGELGTPPKDNIVVVGGQGYVPDVCEGCLICEGGPQGQPPCFFMGGPVLDGDGRPPVVHGIQGDDAELCFYYNSPEEIAPGGAQFNQIQGVSMAVCFDSRLQAVESSFSVPPDSITATLGAEYVNFQADNDPNDGDGCEMILGILMDYIAPFDGRTFPPSEVPLKLACVDMHVDEAAPGCDCLPVGFCDGINGKGKVPIRNLYSAENQSFVPCLMSTSVCISGDMLFLRGDCNRDTRTNIVDAIAGLVQLFALGTAKFTPTCMDACDSNDDGKIDIADPITLLNWLFLSGRALPAPSSGKPGPDPTDDQLTCAPGTCD